MDKIDPARRSRNMAAIKSADTKPEMLVRKWLFSRGYRYRVHYKIEGHKVDLAFPGRKKVLMVHGCFWHGHGCKQEDHRPLSNSSYWEEKIRLNKVRDEEVRKKLTNAGWGIYELWECEIRQDEGEVKEVESWLMDGKN